MTETTRKLLEEYENTWTYEDRTYGGREDAEIERNRLIEEFNNLPLEEQYEVLLEGAKSRATSKDNRGDAIYSFLFELNDNSRIIEILNNQFPEGIKNSEEFTIAHKKDDEVMPFELYRNLLTFIPGTQSYSDLVEKTTIFKDKRGNIDSGKIIAYWSNPDIKVEYKEKYFKEIFKYLDPDKDRARNNRNYGNDNKK